MLFDVESSDEKDGIRSSFVQQSTQRYHSYTRDNSS